MCLRSALIRGLIGVGATLCLLVLASAAAGAVAFGVGDDSLDAYGDSSGFHVLCGWNGTGCGHGGLGSRYTRLIVPYNALATYDGTSSSCVDTSQDPNNWGYHSGAPEPTVQSLHNWLQEAQKDGLQPMLSITWGNPRMTSESDNPAYPTANGYLCGIEALMRYAGPGTNLWVDEWEAFNEPESGLCSRDAAEFELLANTAAAAEGRTSDTIVAGGFANADDPLDGTNHPDCGHPSGDWFVRDYVSAIKAKGLNPSVWSWHPYNDVDASYTGHDNTHQTGDLAAYLNQQFPSHPQFWLTEVGVVLSSHTYGQYLDGSKIAQANAARGFKDLARAPNQAYGGQIARVYWYEYQTYGDGADTGSDTWDAALLGITSADWVEDGHGIPRSSYCVLAYNDAPPKAATDPRCNYASTPNVPWTDWENPNDG